MSTQNASQNFASRDGFDAQGGKLMMQEIVAGYLQICSQKPASILLSNLPGDGTIGSNTDAGQFRKRTKHKNFSSR
jgi:hypothetical protein